MNKTTLKFMKWCRSFLSKIIPDSDILRYLTYLPKFKEFHKKNLRNIPLFDNRSQMYDYLNQSIINNKPIDYLEFGVFEGYTIKYWSKINKDSNSRFYGFDTFEGLPESWGNNIYGLDKNTFDTKGKMPKMNDKRVSFIKGLFQNTLPKFMKTFKNRNHLIIHNDSDLYSSTLFTLTNSNEILTPGTIIIFDEFMSILHEFRALEDYCSSYMRKYKVVAAANLYSQIVIIME
tara:strand:+ start:486 stop:1181 length:696 start_codon:yes stop_codon:yes gene_type:complete